MAVVVRPEVNGAFFVDRATAGQHSAEAAGSGLDDPFPALGPWIVLCRFGNGITATAHD